ncbi:MAG: rod shape-determining protein MreC [Planctomycetes bacterium]|nr:rod shape-determining protein MreC [Planctomycetota bacterium]
MKFRLALSRKQLLGVLLAASAVTSLAGARVAGPLRRLAGLLLPPLSDAPMDVVTRLGAELAADGPARMTPQQAEALRRRNDYLSRLAAYWRYESELYRRRAMNLANFQRMYAPAADLACELIPAHVVAAGTLPYDQTRMLRVTGSAKAPAGSPVTTRLLMTRRAKALPPKLAVVNANCLVGRIISSGAFTARLQLVSDAAFRMRGRIRRIIRPSRPRMVTVIDDKLPRQAPLTPEINDPIDVIARGDGAAGMIVDDVKEYYNVQPGDLLVTDGQGGAGVEIFVGKVTRVERSAKDPHRVTLHVKPAADLDNLREVYILSPVKPPPDLP